MAISALACQVLVLLSIFGVHNADDDFNIDVKQKNAEVYHEQSAKNNEFNYGYQVEKENSQFQHKVKGPDDVTYGCYGYIDPDNEKHLVYYVADRLGYRLVPPNQPTKIFTERVASSINKLNNDLKDKKLDEKVVAWNDLYLPETCRRLNEILTITTPPTPSGKTDTTYPLSRFNQTGRLPSKSPEITTPLLRTSSRPTPPSRQSPSSTESTKSSRTNSQTRKLNTQGLFTTESVKLASDSDVPSTTARGDNYLYTKPSEPESNYQFDEGTNHPITPKTSTGITDDLEGLQNPSPLNSSDTSPLNPSSSDGYTYPKPSNPLPLPDCPQQNPPILGQYNGYVYPIHGECTSSEYNVNQLMIQMEALNKQVLELTANIHALQQINLTSPMTSEHSACHQWLNRQQFPLMIYVPILLPYLGGDFDPAGSQQSFRNPASYAFQKMCADCINK